MDKWREKFMRFMRGRRGMDELGQFLLILSVLTMVITSMTGSGIFGTITIMLLGYTYYRFLSKNVTKRFGENQKFLNDWLRFRFWLQSRKMRLSMRKTHKYYRCKGCGKTVRVPKGKGKICITCPVCGHEFVKKT